MGENCFSAMFYGCTSIVKVYTEQEGWYSIVGSGANATSTFFNQDWLFGVPTSGEFTCKDELERIWDFSHIPYDSSHKWKINPLIDTPFIRYQNFTSEYQAKWQSTSGWNANNELLAIGFYEGTSMGSTAIVYNVALDPSEAVKSVSYPWAPAEKY